MPPRELGENPLESLTNPLPPLVTDDGDLAWRTLLGTDPNATSTAVTKEFFTAAFVAALPTLAITAVSCKDLRDADWVGKSDPYVRFLLGEKGETWEEKDRHPNLTRKAQTAAVENDQNPAFDWEGSVTLQPDRFKCPELHVRVYDKDATTVVGLDSGDLLGECRIPISLTTFEETHAGVKFPENRGSLTLTLSRSASPPSPLFADVDASDLGDLCRGETVSSIVFKNKVKRCEEKGQPPPLLPAPSASHPDGEATAVDLFPQLVEAIELAGLAYGRGTGLWCRDGSLDEKAREEKDFEEKFMRGGARSLSTHCRAYLGYELRTNGEGAGGGGGRIGKYCPLTEKFNTQAFEGKKGLFCQDGLCMDVGTDTQLNIYMCPKEKKLVLFFQGTSTMTDALTDLKIGKDGTFTPVLEKYKDDRCVHAGFLEAWRSVKPLVLFIVKEVFYPDGKPSEEYREVLVGGHSLGGSLAVLSSMSIAKYLQAWGVEDQSMVPNVKARTVGGPVVGTCSGLSCFLWSLNARRFGRS